MRKLLIPFLILGMLIVGCHVEVRNKIRVTGGSFRVLSYHRIDPRTIQIVKGGQTGSQIGIGVVFDYEYYSDGTVSMPWPNTYTEGSDGTADSIVSIQFFGGGKELIENMKNDSSTAFFRMNKNDILDFNGQGRVVCATGSKELFQAQVLGGLEGLKSEYNSTYSAGYLDLNLEHFFWADSSIQEDALSAGVLEIVFGDGRKLRLKNSK